MMGRFRQRRGGLRVAVFGYDLKFIRPILDLLEAEHGMTIEALESGSLHAFPEHDVRSLVHRADVVVAEWFGPYVSRLVEMSERTAPLVVRLHRFELHRGFPNEVDPGAVDTVVCVNDFYAAELQRVAAWPEDRIEVIPNAIDLDRFGLEKTPGAELRIGVLGMASRRKRLDLALDTIEFVRTTIPRAVLSVKSHRPSELKWVMDDPQERRYFEQLEPRLALSLDAGAVEWSEHGPDVEAWLTGIGSVLSVSDDESFHMAPAEGMASGAIPVVRRWPGAETVYDDRWLFDRPDEAAAMIVRTIEEPGWRAEAAELARSEVGRFSLTSVARHWAETLMAVAAHERSG